MAYWAAAQLQPKRDQLALHCLKLFGFETYAPRLRDQRTIRGCKVIKTPLLFPGYVFVCMALRDRLQVQQVPGVAHLVGFDGTPAALPDEEIQALRASLESGVRAEPHPYLNVGRRVRLKSGPLAGLQGILLRRRANFRVVISIELIQRSVAVDADVSDVEAAQ